MNRFRQVSFWKVEKNVEVYTIELGIHISEGLCNIIYVQPSKMKIVLFNMLNWQSILPQNLGSPDATTRCLAVMIPFMYRSSWWRIQSLKIT